MNRALMDMSPAHPPPPTSSHPLDPRPQVGGALVEADGLQEVLLTVRHHQSAVNQAEVVEQGHIQVGFPARVGRAAGTVLPGDALEVDEETKGMGSRGRGLMSVWARKVKMSPRRGPGKWDAFRPATAG